MSHSHHACGIVLGWVLHSNRTLVSAGNQALELTTTHCQPTATLSPPHYPITTTHCQLIITDSLPHLTNSSPPARQVLLLVATPEGLLYEYSMSDLGNTNGPKVALEGEWALLGSLAA